MNRLLFVLLLLPAAAEAQSWQWTRSERGLSSTEGLRCATDASGNVYATGAHWGTIYFGSDTVEGAGAFVLKYDNSGNLKWAISSNAIASTSDVFDLATDLFGNEYLLGIHDTTISFGTHVLDIPGTRNYYYYLAKIDSAGNIIWIENVGNVLSYGGTEGSITTDKEGHILLSCSFTNNPTIGSFSLVNSATDSTDDILVAKFDSSGTVIWAKSYGGKKEDYPMGISVTPSHYIYIAGYFTSDTLTFESVALYDTSTASVSLSYSATFLAKLDSLGNPIWAHGTGGSGRDKVNGLASDSSEEVYIVGYYSTTSIMLGSYTLPYPYRGTYGYLAKYDSSGGVLWTKNLQGQYIVPYSIALDPCENVWISAALGAVGTGGTIWVDTLDGHNITAPSYSYDPMFIAGWSSTGTYLQAIALSSGGDDLSDVAIDRCGNVFIEGDYEVDTFIVGSDTLIKPSSVSEWNFVVKYNPNLGCIASCGGGVTDEQKDLVENSSLLIFPNPAIKELAITAPYPISTVSISNIVGQTVYNHNYYSDKVQINITDLPSGIYFIKINATEVRKFVKE